MYCKTRWTELNTEAERNSGPWKTGMLHADIATQQTCRRLLTIWARACLALAVTGDTAEGRALGPPSSAASLFSKTAAASCWAITWLAGDRLTDTSCFWWILPCCCSAWAFSFCLACCLACSSCCSMSMGVGSGGVDVVVGGGDEGGVAMSVGALNSLGW